jgi:hypothetical protein
VIWAAAARANRELPKVSEGHVFDGLYAVRPAGPIIQIQNIEPVTKELPI